MTQGYEKKDETYFGNPRSEIAHKVPLEAHRVLDIGCGEGSFGDCLRQTRPGLEVWGIEPVEHAAMKARERVAHVLHGPIEEKLNELPDGYFDCITFNDVLEHLVDPWNILKEIRPKLSENGVVLASIPNIAFFPVVRDLVLKGTFEYAEDGVLDSTHLRFFTRKSMLEMFESCGYDAKVVDRLHWYTFPMVFKITNILMNRAFDDMHYRQFLVSASARHR